MENSDFNKMIELLLEAPDTQIDPSVKERLSKSPSKEEFLSIMDDCVYGSLVSDFAMQALKMTFLMIGNEEDILSYKSKYSFGPEAQ